MACLKQTFFVTSLALFALLTACQTHTEQSSPAVAGASSTAGQVLTQQEWCTDSRLDEDKHFVIDHFSFNVKGKLTVTSQQLQTDGSTTPVATSEGTWAIMNGDLFMMHGQETLRSKLTSATRAADMAKCYELKSDNTTALLCACQN